MRLQGRRAAEVGVIERDFRPTDPQSPTVWELRLQASQAICADHQVWRAPEDRPSERQFLGHDRSKPCPVADLHIVKGNRAAEPDLLELGVVAEGGAIERGVVAEGGASKPDVVAEVGASEVGFDKAAPVRPVLIGWRGAKNAVKQPSADRDAPRIDRSLLAKPFQLGIKILAVSVCEALTACAETNALAIILAARRPADAAVSAHAIPPAFIQQASHPSRRSRRSFTAARVEDRAAGGPPCYFLDGGR